MTVFDVKENPMIEGGEARDSDPIRLRNEDFSRSVHALFDSGDHAETARQDLIAAGIQDRDISILGDGGEEASPASQPGLFEAGGFWETMKELFMPEEDRNQFEEGVRRGGVTISVRTDTANHDRVIDILDRDGAVDLDERQESWRHDGWTGYTGRDPLSEARTPALALEPDIEDMSYAPPSAAIAGFGASEADRFPTGEDTAPLVESPGALPASALLAAPEGSTGDAAPPIGMRDTSHGRARVRAYVAPAPGQGSGL